MLCFCNFSVQSDAQHQIVFFIPNIFLISQNITNTPHVPPLHIEV
jgi:hypothetical protein